ncbi:MAG: methylase [Verrucomicrobia bacterium]|nr:methylase [Verrucomicrobiota bacterium]
MTEVEQRRAAKEFAKTWKDRGYEKGESQSFWIALLGSVFGIPHPENYIEFENQVQTGHTNFIDATIPTARVIIEQKNKDVDLSKAYKQSDGSYLTPYEQAKRYADGLEYSRKPRWIVTCNFQEFRVHDMEYPNKEPEIIRLADLPKEYYRLSFLVDPENTHVRRELELSIQAGEIVGKLYDEILKNYIDPNSEETLKSLNILCVRLVFCLYAEDSGIFGKRNIFQHYLGKCTYQDLRDKLITLFKVLDTKIEDRDPYLNKELASFPYVNGGLFEDESIEIPQLNAKVQNLLFAQASEGFDWSGISPTIFGAVFESTLNPETRRSGGMHYTSIENIHKVIDPLFLDGLKAELEEIKKLAVVNTRDRRLIAFQNKLAGLTFLDPACGSGNFLTETYLSLRKLENEVLKILYQDQMLMNIEGFIKVSIGQFYGIEINDFAVTVAKTALWIAESQMMKETEEIIRTSLDFLPLKSYANIVEGNALGLDWNTVVPKEKLSYIMGNPPFVGFTYMSDAQKSDVQYIFPGTKNLDFVCCWYKKADDFISETKILVAFVSTNSICQGETVPAFWPKIRSHIHFAHRTFRWDSEAKSKAHVHCIIVGFGFGEPKNPVIFNEGGHPVPAKNISSYLIDAPNVVVWNRNKPLCIVQPMIYGNKPTDGGNLILSEEEYQSLIISSPEAKKFIRRLLGAEEYINNKVRYCLWLVHATPAEIRNMPEVLKRVEAVRKMRENSKAKATRDYAIYPTLFRQITQPEGKNYIIVPRVSSESRRYIPMGFIQADVIVSDSVQIIPDATLSHFGILTSNIHMAWMRTVCGRLKSDYRYSKDIVYNNFPWPEVSDADRLKIETTAQGILDAREFYPDCSLADLYDETTMPQELRKAHQANDKAVMAAYGYGASMTEPEIVADLMKRYQELTAKKD